jgi:beta-galactosidase
MSHPRTPQAMLIAAAALFLLTFTPDSPAESVRARISLNESWHFKFGVAGDAARPDHDTRDWDTVDVPHTWNGDDAWDDEPGYDRGVGWYRRELEIPPELADRRLVLVFDAVSQTAEVFVNGESVATHVGGYTAFAADITDVIRRHPNGPHVIAVKASNAFDPDVPPLSADFTFYGGMYRDVWLLALDDVHFDPLDHASPGIYVDTPTVTADHAKVRVRGRVRNTATASDRATVDIAVRAPAGNTVATASLALDLPADAVIPFEIPLGPIESPALWSPESPALYTVTCRLVRDGAVGDELSLPLGFRWFHFDAAKGFFLNGKPLKLRGTNRHQDVEGLGVAVPDMLHIRDVQLIKAMGANFLRLAHYPQDSAVLEACDRLGLVVWEEIPVVNYVTRSDAFRANCRTMLLDMIRQHHNHPSILMWGYMNEIFLYGPDGQYTPRVEDAEYAAWVVGLARELDALVRAEDPSRVSVMAAHGSDQYNDYGIADVPQVLGWNIYHGWYADHVNGLGGFLDKQHRDYPDRPLLVSEYGAGSDRRLHSLSPQRFDFTIEWQQHFHESALEQFEERDYLGGYAIWNQCDFGVERRGDSIPHLNQKGVSYYNREPKDIYFLYRAHWHPEHVTHIATRDWKQRVSVRTLDGQLEPPTHPIWVYSDAEKVELLCNGVSRETRQVPPSGRVEWHVLLAPGRNELVARGAYDRATITSVAVIDHEVCDLRTADEIAINVGAPVSFRAADGRTWLPDRAYTPGAYGYVDGRSGPFQGNPNVCETEADPLFQHRRVELSGYRIDVPDGKYEVELRFLTSERDSARAPVLAVQANGDAVISDVPLVAPGPGLRGVVHTFPVTVDAGDGIQLTLSATRGATHLCAVRVTRAGGAASARGG